ncbi:uncharacterized protein LOC131939508 isoform X2 [Physella acuta]|uniref:uncharacterized protein LOC131939508 isoform X2 n=1 Tax=Physella acuta TaxID=109671 RepID=UPI0027DD7FE6|nr:uncharacterized protein LOC131939508 isoform X2 [Physella acuta]
MKKHSENEWNSTVSDSTLGPMESPLDVLSRAASMIETSSGGIDSLFNDTRPSPGKDLPTKSLKHDRLRDRQEVTGALEADRDHADRLSHIKRSTSTQTQFSSFSCENLPPPPYYPAHVSSDPDTGCPLVPPYQLPPPLFKYTPHTNSQLPPPPLLPASLPPPNTLPPSPVQTHPIRHQPDPSLPPPPLSQVRSSPPVTPLPPYHTSCRSCSPPPSLPPYHSSCRSCSPPPPPKYSDITRLHVDVQHAPLNLSLSSSQTATSRTPYPGSSGAPSTGEAYRDRVEPGETQHRTLSNQNGSNHESAAQVTRPIQISDEAIEEHFRRSLGKCYSEPSPPKQMTVSEKICSVDDHFARALGDQMWTEIKARSEPPPIDAGSVDAHFAKALGESMWRKLKAEKKLDDDVNSQQQPTNQHQSSSPLQTPLVT